MSRNDCIINLDNLKYNVNQIRKHTGKKIIAIVKADAYGHGAIEVSKTLVNEVDYLAVACIDEAIELRHNNIAAPILILGHTDEHDFEVCSSQNFTVTIHDLFQIDKIKYPLKVHLKVDTGMNRIGLREIDDIKQAIVLIKQNHNIILEGIFTHYATADCDDAFYHKQFDKFQHILRELDYKFDYIHSSSSAAAINYLEDFTNTIRPGIVIYGIDPNNDNMFDVKPVLSLNSKIVQLKKVNAGERVGYANGFITDHDVYIATVPIGYGDGWLRRNNKVPVYINGRPYNIVGRICMDMMMVEVDESVKLGDIVELIGPNITADDIASKTDTISYEVVCNLGRRLERRYIK